MRPLRYSINVSLDGCVGHDAFRPSAELHDHAAATIERADALLFGRVTYQLMEFWRDPWVAAEPFAKVIGAARKYVVSSTLESVDWNAEIIRPAELEATVRRLKEEPGEGLYCGGVQLPRTLAELGLIDEYEFVVHPCLAGRGPTLFAGLGQQLDLEPVGRQEFEGGVVATTYVPRT